MKHRKQESSIPTGGSVLNYGVVLFPYFLNFTLWKYPLLRLANWFHQLNFSNFNIFTKKRKFLFWNEYYIYYIIYKGKLVEKKSLFLSNSCQRFFNQTFIIYIIYLNIFFFFSSCNFSYNPFVNKVHSHGSFDQVHSIWYDEWFTGKQIERDKIS